MLNTAKQQLAALDSMQAPGHQDHDDWLRVRQVVAHYNVGRSFVYTLLRDGVLKSVSLKRRGCIRGIRLISRASFEDYLSGLVLAQKEVGK
jgi:hypothetical protein